MTSRVDFYVLKSATAQQRRLFACRLVEKAYLRDLKVVVLGDADAEVADLDQLLWTFHDRSFVPHEVGAATEPDAAPVRLTADLAAIDAADLLVNLSGRSPDRLDRFERIAEIIDGDDERRRLGRERFKAYRELKIPVETHQLDDTAAP